MDLERRDVVSLERSDIDVIVILEDGWRLATRIEDDEQSGGGG